MCDTMLQLELYKYEDKNYIKLYKNIDYSYVIADFI